METFLNNRYDICIKCQACCKKFCMEVNGDAKTLELMAEFLQTWGFIIYPSEDDKYFYAIINHPCKHITKEGCSIYLKRPLYCKTYEGLNDPGLKRFCKLKPIEDNSTRVDLNENNRKSNL